MTHHWQRVFTKGAYLVLLACVICTPIKFAHAQRTPLLVVPGILGSQLCDGTTVIWGDRGSLQDFARLDTLSEQGRQLKPCGLLKKIQLLGSFWATDGYDVLLAQLSALGFREGSDLILFDYDWRRSNFETAEVLKRRLRTSTGFQTGQFDVIAHSMGGLVTRILLNDPEFAPRVRRVIYLATPFLGSSNALGILTDGWGTFLNLVAGESRPSGKRRCHSRRSTS